MSDTSPPRPLAWYRTPGLRVLAIPPAVAAVWWVLRWFSWNYPEQAFEWLPYFVLDLIQIPGSLEGEPAMVAAGSLLVLLGLAGLVDRMGWLRWATPLVPAGLWLWLVATAHMFEEVRLRAEPLRGMLRPIVRDFGPEGCAAGFVGLFVVGGGIALRLGSLRACPECGKWWGERMGSRVSGRTVTDTGGHFGEGGWTRTREVTSTGVEQLRCVHCGHAWSRRYAIKRREKKAGVFSTWERR